MPTTTERRWYFDEASRAILEKPDPNMPGQYCSTVVLKVPDEYHETHAIWPQAVADGKLAAAAPRMLAMIRKARAEADPDCMCESCRETIALYRELGVSL